MVLRLSDNRHEPQVPHSNGRTFDLDKILSKLSREERVFVSSLIGKDPLTGLYNKGIVLYMLLLFVLLLWPFDFTFFKAKNHVHWIGTSNGVEFSLKGQILSVSSTRSLCDRLLTGTGFSLEVWVAAQNEIQSGPARIVSYSLNTSLRNFTLGQAQKNLVMRLRTTGTDPNGTKPCLIVDHVFRSADPQHIVVTYDFSVQSVYTNGESQAREEIPGGTFTNWDPSYYLVLGNEATGDRPWLGKIFYVAIYNRVLGEQEIRQNYLAGCLLKSSIDPEAHGIPDGLVARYLFEEAKGDKVADSSGSHTPMDLYIPGVIQTYEKPYLGFPYRSLFQDSHLFQDLILNIVAFVPLGFLFHAALRRRYGSSLKASAFVLIIGTLFSFSIESLQYFSLTRHSSLVDIFDNMLGTAVGITTERWYTTFLKSQRTLLGMGPK